MDGHSTSAGSPAKREATCSSDTAPILNDELTRLDTPLPPEIAGPGPKGVDAEAQEILRTQVIQRFDERQYRQALGTGNYNADTAQIYEDVGSSPRTRT
jgi:hypothetical protein